MTKQIILAAMLIAAPLTGIRTNAQNTAEPNRILLNFPGGFNYKSYVVDQVDSITFRRIDGEVKAEINIIEVTEKALKLDVERTNDCEGFMINVLPQSVANQLKNPTAMFSYLNSINSPKYYEDFYEGELTGLALTPGGDYCVVTAAYDELGTEVDCCRADFQAYARPVVGNPEVKAELVEATLDSFTIRFTPNGDVSKYYTVAGEKGTLEEQYDRFGPMFGASSMSQLIQMWGIATEGEKSNTWTSMTPNTDYEVYILPLDKEGNYAPLQIFECSTLSKGGDGEAMVEITPTKYELADWEGFMRPSQYIKFTPNDQTFCYRYGVYKKDVYDAAKDEIQKELCSDPEMPTAYWFFYDELETDFQINENTEVVIIAAAKNKNKEWGRVNEVRYTTPATVSGAGGQGAKAPANAEEAAEIARRIRATQIQATPGSGCLPQLRRVGMRKAQ